MPGHSTGTHPKSHPHGSSRSRADGYRQGRVYSSSTSQETHKEAYGEQPRSTDAQFPRKSHAHYTNGRGSESLGFIPGSVDSPQVNTHACGSCASLGWSGCKALLCCILTCGLYGSRKPCLPPNESSTDNPSKAEVEPRKPNGVALSNPTCGVSLEEGKTRQLPSSGSFRYGDVRIAGKRVEYPLTSDAAPCRTRTTMKEDSQRPISHTSISREGMGVSEDVEDGGTDIDSLITKKLLELYKLHQIEQLAKCTSDLSFSRKTNEISELINSIAHDYNLEEQEAECRLVHGVIRISTRNKSSKGSKSRDYKMQEVNGRRDGTLPDSGNETMTFTFPDEPEVMMSAATDSDVRARGMREKHYYSSSATDSSGAPLLR